MCTISTILQGPRLHFRMQTSQELEHLPTELQFPCVYVLNSKRQYQIARLLNVNISNKIFQI